MLSVCSVDDWNLSLIIPRRKKYHVNLNDFYMIYNSNWFEYPTKLQKYAILTIARSQQPVYFTGFGLISCTSEVFGKVSIAFRKKFFSNFLMLRFFCVWICKTASSYYVMFRTIDQRLIDVIASLIF